MNNVKCVCNVWESSKSNKYIYTTFYLSLPSLTFVLSSFISTIDSCYQPLLLANRYYYYYYYIIYRFYFLTSFASFPHCCYLPYFHPIKHLNIQQQHIKYSSLYNIAWTSCLHIDIYVSHESTGTSSEELNAEKKTTGLYNRWVSECRAYRWIIIT